MRAYHFLTSDCRMRDGTPVVVGETYRVQPPLVLCKHGLHASTDPLDALHYAPGTIACRVTMGGEIVQDDDKMVATERTVIKVADATETLRRFARLCALDVVHLWDAPDIVVKYLRSGNEDIQAAAWAAARAAAWAAQAAAWAAARAAAWAAQDAARAARAAAWAAQAAAWAAARAAAQAAQSRRLRRMLNELWRA